LLAGCARGPAPTPTPVAAATRTEAEVVVLPNNTVLHCLRSKVTAVRREGDVAWELTLPYGDALVAPPAVALNSVAYFRGSNGVYAATPDGKWAWSKPLDKRPSGTTPAIDAPVTFPDSTVAVAVGDEVVRLDDRGAVRWRVTVPDGHVNSRLSAGMDGALFVPTTAGLYCVSPDGNIAWKRAIGG
jgi:outer membrane protein assembly factor BamB